MQKLIMMSNNDGCIFTAPISELIQNALVAKEITEISIGNNVAYLYFVDESFYLRFRAYYPEFHLHSLLVSFIQSNIDKTILVGEFSEKAYPLDCVGKILKFLTLVNEGIEIPIAHEQVFR